MPFQFESKEEFETMVATVTSQMVGARTKQLKKEIVDEVGKSFEEFGKKLAPQFEEIKTLATAQPQGGKKKDKGEKDGDGAEPDVSNQPAFRTMQKQIEELRANNARLEEERKASEAKRQGMTVRSRLREVLEGAGVSDPHKLRAATAILVDADRKVAWADSLEDAAFIDVDGAPIELELGVKQWLKSDEGEHYTEPTGTKGAGTRPTRKGSPQEQKPKMTEAELGMQIIAAMNGVPVSPGGT
jgi:hypothetical protein